MLSRVALKLLQTTAVNQVCRRNLGLTSVVMKLDPVQQVFIDQIHKYQQLSKKQGGGTVDAGPEYNQAKDEAVSRIAKLYDVGNPMEFPSFEFVEPDLNQDEADLSRE